MSTLLLLKQTTPQVCGAKQNVAKPKPTPFLSKRIQASAVIDTFNSVLGEITPKVSLEIQMDFETKPKIDIQNRAFELVSREYLLKQKTLALIQNDKSTPMELHLRRGTIKELDDGIFAKRRLDGVLEIYVSEQ